jgi:hypothetical protein
MSRGGRRSAGTVAVIDLYRELRAIIDALDRAGVGYALVGGLAVSIYTTPRATEDVDMAIAPEDADNAVTTLAIIGFRQHGRAMTVANGRLEIRRLLKIDGTDLLPLDILVARDPGLAALLQDRVAVDWEGRPINIVSVASLRALKRLRGSAQDRADLEALGPEAP